MTAQRRDRSGPQTADQIAESRQDWRAEVAAAAAADAAGPGPELLGSFLDRLTDSGPARPWDRQRRAEFVALGSRAAEQGVALPALVDLYLSAAWRAWPLLPAVAHGDAEAIRAAGRTVLHASDGAVEAVAEGFAAAGRAMMRREESLRREFVDDLLSGTGDPAGLLARADSYGLRLSGPQAVLLARAATAFRDAAPALSEVAAAVAALGADLGELVTTRDGHLVVVVSAPSADLLDPVAAAVRRALDRPGGRPPGPSRLVLGRAYAGPSGVARSYAEARDALALTDRLGLAEPLVRAEDLVVYQMLARDREALADVVETVLAPLRRARGGAGPLLETLDAYLGTGGNTTRAAARLHMSVRAVTYRLARIGDLTGRDPADPRHRYVLHTAVVGARVLGWPDPPPA